MSNGLEVCLITPPPPLVHLEVFFIAVVVDARRRLFSTRVSELRYYTLERGYDPETSQDIAVVCQCLEILPNLKRRNYGIVASASKRHFREAIEEIIATEKQSELERDVRCDGSFVGTLKCGSVAFIKDRRGSVTPNAAYSAVHGTGHVMVRGLYDPNLGMSEDKLREHKKLLKVLETWARIRNGYWTEEQEEAVVRQFEIYVSLSLNTPPSKGADEQLSSELRHVFETIAPLNKRPGRS